MRQTFDDAADLAFGRQHVPLIRAEMVRQGLDGFLIPHEDEHQNEYLPEANERLAWATGFTGSAGAAVVLTDQAAVFSDGRYTLQLAGQTDADVFERLDFVEGGVPAYLETRGRAGPPRGDAPRRHPPPPRARGPDHRLRSAPAQPRPARPAEGCSEEGRG